MSAIGITTYRTGGAPWWDVEPTEGKWNWDEWDLTCNYLASQHMSFGCLIGGTPKWSKHGPEDGPIPRHDIAAWSNFVRHIVEHSKGTLKYLELLNEPPNGLANGETPADYAKFVAATYDAAHSVDSNAAVGMCAKSAHLNWLEQTIKAGARDHFDCIILHPYETLGTALDHPGAEAVFMGIVPTVRKMLAAQDPDKLNVPVLCTELGFDAGRGAPLQAYAVVKAYTMGIAQGMACIEWFEGMDGDSGPMGLLMGNGTPRPAYTALAQMIKYLGPHPAYIGWVLLNNKDYGFVFRGAKGPVMITWAEKGTTDNVDFVEAVSIVNPMTGHVAQASTCSLTEGPVIVDGPPSTIVMQAQGNRRKPFPWGGDYTNAQSVSVTFGQTNIEKGLHTQSAKSIAEDVVAYGGSARSGSIPGGTVFMVDPNFLSYNQTPIQISAVVRRNQANDSAALKMNYESTNGFKSTNWYTVPDNKDWHTATWTVTDAEFVSMWGYNFSFDSNGNYFIKSVTVTKLSR
jgi:hypothetical protein